MPRKSVPSYRLHKPSGQARTIVRGKHIYLGKYNSPESRRKYARLLAEMSQPTTQDIAAGPNPRSLLLVSEILAKYLVTLQKFIMQTGTNRARSFEQ